MADKTPESLWLEAELARQFCRVSAPDGLWRRIHEQRRPLRVRSHRWMAWSVGVVALVTIVAGLVWRSVVTGEPSPELEMMARTELREMANGGGRTDIRSSDPVEIRAWVKAKSGIDVRLAGSGAIRLIGARLVRSGDLPVVVISYRVGDDFAAMLVEGGNRGHASPRAVSHGDMRLYSWQRGADHYTIAFAGTREPQRACLLCHADPAALMVLR